MVITHTQDLHKHLTSNLPSPNGIHFYYWDDVTIPKTLPGKELYKNKAQTKFGWGKTSLIVVTLKTSEMSAIYDHTKSEKATLSTEPGCFIWPFQTGPVNLLTLVTNYPLFSSRQHYRAVGEQLWNVYEHLYECVLTLIALFFCLCDQPAFTLLEPACENREPVSLDGRQHVHWANVRSWTQDWLTL